MLEKRYILAILAFFTTFNVYSLRNGITVRWAFQWIVLNDLIPIGHGLILPVHWSLFSRIVKLLLYSLVYWKWQPYRPVLRSMWLWISIFTRNFCNLAVRSSDSEPIRLIQQIKQKALKTILCVLLRNWIRNILIRRMGQVKVVQKFGRRILFGTKKTRLIYWVPTLSDTGINFKFFRDIRESRNF